MVFLSELADVGIYNSQNMDEEIDPNWNFSEFEYNLEDLGED